MYASFINIGSVYLFSLPSTFFSHYILYIVWGHIYIYTEVQLEEDTRYKLPNDVQKIYKVKYRIFDNIFATILISSSLLKITL